MERSGCFIKSKSICVANCCSSDLEELILLRAWTSGSIYDPATGNTYTCHLALDGDDRLRLRGFVGIPLLGRTTTWTRVGAENRMCREDDR